MLIFRKERIVIVTPPKTASTSLHVSLSAKPHNAMAVVGESMFPGNVDKHTCRIPNEASGFKVLATIRHPLDRLVSLYCHYVREESLMNGRYSMAFWDFANRVCRNGEPVTGHDIDRLYKWTQSRHLEGVAVDGYIRFENIHEDLADNGIRGVCLEKLNESHRREWKSYFDDSLLDVAREWASTDMILGGYDTSGVLDRYREQKVEVHLE